VEIHNVPEDAYLCRYGPSYLDAIRALPFGCGPSACRGRLTFDRETRSPSDSTSWSTRRVETLHT